MSAAAAPANANSSASNGEGAAVERRCENADCNAAKLLSLVPKRKTAQFITDPNVMERPMLINGFTTVFQVDGSSAKLADLNNVPNGGAQTPKTIYRIVPNTHAHIVNYVVVDAEGESLRKINDSDPATMRKLLESQKVSADQMLKKLIAGVSVGISSTTNASRAPSTPAPKSAAATTTAAAVTKQSPVAPLPAAAAPASAAGVISPAQIQLPLRMHPNLKITAVAGAESVPVTPAVVTAAPPTVPLITPVPLATLQSAPPARPAVAPSLPVASAPVVVDAVDKPVFDKMQAELQELRRTVALLAEAQAKSQQQPSPVPSAASGSASGGLRVKRMRQS